MTNAELPTSTPPSDPLPAPRSSNIDRYLAFAFGIIFFGALLYLATIEKNPTALQTQIYVTILAIAAGGIGAILPGFIEVKYKGAVRAGGALGLAALIYLNAPAIAKYVPDFQTPTASSKPTIDAFFTALDSGDPDKSWVLLPEAARSQVNNSFDVWRELYKNDISPLGRVQSRIQIGQSLMKSPPGVPPGVYAQYTYKTKFANDAGYRTEMLILRGNSQDAWEVYSYQISTAATP
jgi:hypothetical protein